MTPSRIRQTAFRLDSELLAAMQALKDRDGMPWSEQVRRALRAFLAEKGVMGKAERKQPASRKRS